MLRTVKWQELTPVIFQLPNSTFTHLHSKAIDLENVIIKCFNCEEGHHVEYVIARNNGYDPSPHLLCIHVFSHFILTRPKQKKLI